MSDTNRTLFSYVQESTFGTTPASPEWQPLRTTGQPGLQGNPQTVTSDEIRSDRQVTDLILVSKEAGGNTGAEVSFETLDDLLEGALFNAWDNQINAKNASADEKIFGVLTISDSAFDTVSIQSAFTANLATQSLIRQIAFTNSANVGFFEAVSVDTAGIYYVNEGTLTTEATVPANAHARVVGFRGATAELAMVTSGGNRMTSSGIDLTQFDLEAGDWIKVGHDSTTANRFTTTAANGWFRIASISSAAMTFDVVPTSFAASTGGGRRIDVYIPDTLKNGTTEYSFSCERQFTDHASTLYEVYTGMELGSFQQQLRAKSIATVTATFLGKDVDYSTTRTAGSTDASTNSDDVLNTSSNVARIAENGTSIGTNYATQLDWTVNNNLRRKEVIGQLGTIAMGAGEFMVTGTLTTLFEDKTYVEKVIDNTATSLDYRLTDSNSHAIVYDFPKVKYSSGGPNVPGKNQEVDAALGFQAYMHPTLSYTMKICRFWGIQ